MLTALQVAQQRYDAVLRGQPERLVSGSDDHTMFLWTPSTSKTHMARMTGHVQLINQVRKGPGNEWWPYRVCATCVPWCRRLLALHACVRLVPYVGKGGRDATVFTVCVTARNNKEGGE